MRTLIAMTALLMGIPAFGSWDTNSWPSTNRYRIPVTTNYLAATNYWAKEHVDEWDQTSTTNYIPELTYELLGAYNDFVAAGYQLPIGGYSATNNPTATNGITRSWTNIYWTSIVDSPSTNTTENWYGTNQLTNVYNDILVTVTSEISGGMTNYYTNSVTNITVTTTVFAVTSPTNIDWNLDVEWKLGQSWIIVNGCTSRSIVDGIF